ncbi:hypothetical protein D3C87_1654810 [compost metagenome]
MFQSALFGNMPATGTNNDDQFTFEIQFLGDTGTNDRLAMPDKGRGETGEKGRIGRLLVRTFLGVLGIVQAYADYFPRALDRRQITYLG